MALQLTLGWFPARRLTLPVHRASPLRDVFKGVTPFDMCPEFMVMPTKQNGIPITEDESTIFNSDVAKGLAFECLLSMDRVAFSHISDPEEMTGICFQNMFRLLVSIKRVNQIQRTATADRERVIRAALTNRDHEIKCLKSTIALKDLGIEDLRADVEEYY